MRTFRFITSGSLEASEDQVQTISCSLYLDPANDITTTQPDNCSCHSEADCSTPGQDQLKLLKNTSKLNFDISIFDQC